MFEAMSPFFEAAKLPNTWSNRSYEYRYWFRSLLQKIDSSVKIKNLPKEWPQDFFLFCLWSLGWVAVFRSERFGDTESGLAFNPCTVNQYRSFYYTPTECTVSNPLFTKTFKIHKDAELIKLTPDAYCGGFGCFDILDFYADKLAECSKGIKMGLINAKMPVVIGANNEAQAQKVKAIYDKIQCGETLITYGEKLNDFGDEVIPSATPFDSWLNDFAHTYIVDKLLADMKELMNQFYMEIGLPVPDTAGKKSHLLETEVDFTGAQSQARAQCWKNTLEESFKNIERTFHYRMEVELHAESLQNDSVGNGTVSESRRGSEEKSS